VARRRALGDLVTSAAMQPGRYTLRGKVAVRQGTTLPAHLHRAKGEGRERARGVRIARALAATLAMSPPVTLNRRGDAEGGDVCVVGRGGTLVLSTTGDWVERRFDRPLIDDAYLQRRAALARHLPCPEVLQVREPNVFREELIHGRHVRDAGPSAPAHVLASLWTAAATAGRAADVGASQERSLRYRQAIEAAPWEQLPRTLREALNPAVLDHFISDVGYPMSHGDLSEENIILTDSGLRVLDIDPRFLGPRPFWFDPITVMMVDPLFHDLLDQSAAIASIAVALQHGSGQAAVEMERVQQDLRTLCALWSLARAIGVLGNAELRDARPWTPAAARKLRAHWEARPKALV